MTDIAIAREVTPATGRYVARIEGADGEAELTYRRAAAQLAVIVADHTYAPDSMRGTGVARVLVDRLIADARAEGVKIQPSCSYVKAQFALHPEWSDVLAT